MGGEGEEVARLKDGMGRNCNGQVGEGIYGGTQRCRSRMGLPEEEKEGRLGGCVGMRGELCQAGCEIPGGGGGGWTTRASAG